MRTKGEKNHKKAAEEKLKLNLPSPKVVLNASECARLLDGKGKTSVLLVEKGGKMVPAASVVSPPESSETSIQPLGSEANPKHTHSMDTVPTTDSLKLKTEAEKISGCETSSEDLSSTIQKGEVSTEVSKTILKPPKKRRGLEKKFESSNPSLEVVNNGDISHHSSPLRESVDVSSLHRTINANPKSELPPKAEFSKKHSVENLLLPSSSTSSANMMLQSNISHHSFDTRTHPPQAPVAITQPSTHTVPISQPTSTEGYQSIASYHIALAQPPSQLYSHTSFTANAHSQNHISLPYGVNTNQATQSVVFNANLTLQTPQSVNFLNKQASPNEHAPSISLLAAAAVNSLSISPNFQHLPEQEEPMNLSKSCKPAVGAITLQSHSNVGVNESRTAEDVSVNIVSQHSPAQGLTESTVERFPQEPPAAKKKTKKKIPKAQKSTVSDPQGTLQTTKVSIHNGLNDSNKKSVKNSDSAILISSFNSDGIVESSKTVSLDPNPKTPGVLAEGDNTANSLNHSNETSSLSHVSDGNAVEAHSPKSSMTESTPSQDNPDTVVVSCGDKLLPPREQLSETLDQPLPIECAKKSKRPPKKKAEVPMDEESCASRKALYSETIDDVIANYVYIPEPMDEFVLTEEEEAAIRDQFEDHSEVCSKDTVTNQLEVINKADDNTVKVINKTYTNNNVKVINKANNAGLEVSSKPNDASVEVVNKADDASFEIINKPNNANVEIINEANRASVEVITKANNGSVETINKANDASVETINKANDASVETINKTNSGSVETINKANNESVETINKANGGSVETINKANDASLETINNAKDASVETIIKATYDVTGDKGNLTSPVKVVDDSIVKPLCNQAHGCTQTDLSDSDSDPPPLPIKPLKKRPNSILAKCQIPRPKQEAKTTSSHIDSVLAFVAADVLNSTPPMESGLGDELLRLQKKIQFVGQGIIQNADIVQNNNNKVLDDIKVVSSDVMCQKEKIYMDTSIIKADTVKLMPNDVIKESETNKVPKVKKIRKKVGEFKKSSLSDVISIVSDGDVMKKEDIMIVKKKKVAQVKSVIEQKNPELCQPAIPYSVDSVAVSDKEILSTNRVETSDIGESIASTSGGSEQDMPIHEPDCKDETPTSDPCSAEKESQDTGLESGGDDSKPVKKYKKRLDFVKCAHCEHQARGRSALSRHMKKIHMMDVNMPYKCHKCDYGCTKMASLNRHLFTHGVFPCSRCDFVADERIKLGQHVVDQHKDKLDMKLCKVCNRYIKCDQSTIESHTEVCQGPTPFKCSECEKEFKYASSLRVHYHTHFPDQPKRFKCDLCEYRTNYKANLHKHHKNMHASRDRDVQCPECGKLFSTEDNMRRHRKVHTLVRPFACEICKKTFKTSGALKGHHLIHTATRPYSCSIPGCNRSFRTPKFLKSHQEEFHRLVPKKFFCSVEGCNYSFFKRSHLKRHAITHTGERNFHCTWPNCSKSFRHADNLKVHFRSHTNEKPVQCHLCDFKCKQKNSLFWHKKKVHHIIDASFCLKRSDAKAKPEEMDKDGDEIEDQEASSSNSGQPQTHSDEAEAQTSEEVDVDKKSDSKQLDTSLGGECVAESEKEDKAAPDLNAPNSEAHERIVEAQSVVTPKKSGVPEATPVMKEQSISTQTPISRDCGPRDLYEFNSDNESEEETPGNFRRDKIAKAILTPLPPPPKELLMKNEMLEKKEKEKKEKAERREQEKKEKAEKKEQEKKERSEKKELEKKERIEKKEQEKKEKAEKKLMEKKEKAEKKEQEKKEKEQEKKEKEQEKKEKFQEKKEKEQEKKEKLQEKKEKEQEKKEKLQEKKGKLLENKEKVHEKKEKQIEKKEKQHEKQPEKKEKLLDKKEKQQEKRVTDPEKKEKSQKKSLDKKELKPDSKRGSVDESEKNKVESPVDKKKSKALVSPGRRKRSSSVIAREEVNDVFEEPEQTRPTRKKRGKPVDSPRNDGPESSKEEMSTPSPAKRKKVLHKKTDSPDESQTQVKTSRVMLRRSSVSKAPVTKRGRKKGRLAPPKRKPSARILAKKKATTKVKAAADTSKAQKIVPKRRTGRKRSSTKPEEEVEEVEEELVKAKSPKEELPVVESKVEEKKVSPRRKSEEVKKAEVKPKEESDEQQTVVARPHSPAYSEELMLQGKASPYRDFSDADDTVEEEEEDGKGVVEETTSPVEDSSKVVQGEERKTELESAEPELNDDEDDEDSKSVLPTADESSDDEVSNDIPLTPPRAPAPPPMESSEDEMEPEPASAPFSVPGPNTPFSVPGPNTPFSVPPPTNLIQQHSVHSEEAPMSAVPSVPSMEMHSQGSVEMQQSLGSVEMNHPLSVEMNHPHGSVEMHHSHGSVEMHHSHGSVEMHHSHGSVEMHHSHGSVEMHHSHGSVEMHHPHGSVEMHHARGSVEMHHPHGSVEMHHPHGSVEMHHPHGSVEMHHPHGSIEMHHSHGSVERHSHSTSSEMHTHNSGEIRSHNSVDMHHSVQSHRTIQEPEQHRSVRTPDNGREAKYDLPPLQGQSHTMDADKEYFDQYLKSLSAANNSAANGEHPTSGLRELEAMVGKSHQDLRDIGSRSPISSLPSSVMSSLESTLPILGAGDLRARMDVFDRHHESLYVRDTPSSLPRLSDPRSVTPLPPNAAFDAYSSLNSLHPGATASSSRESSYLRQPDNLFPTPPVTSNFMAEAMFQHQAMSTSFLPPQPSDRSSLSRIPDTTQLRSNSSSLLRRTSAMPGTDMFSTPAIPQAMPRNPFTNAWASQDTRASHWQTPYLQRQPNMTTPSSFFPSKENYLTGREFMFDPSVRQSAERAMFPSLSSSQTQDTFQLDRFDLSNYFPNAMTPYASSTGTLDYTRSAHSAAAKPFDERYRQSAAASAGIPDFRGLPPSTGSSDMFSGLPSVNSGFNLYASNPMSYHHPQHMTDNVNSAFLSHSTSAQHAMFERDYAAHRGLYPQNTPYPFIDDRQYGAPSKLTHTHPVAPTATSQERDLMSRSGGPESQMQDPYRSVLYRY